MAPATGSPLTSAATPPECPHAAWPGRRSSSRRGPSCHGQWSSLLAAAGGAGDRRFPPAAGPGVAVARPASQESRASSSIFEVNGFSFDHYVGEVQGAVQAYAVGEAAGLQAAAFFQAQVIRRKLRQAL